MKMNHKDALSVLGLKLEDISNTPEALRDAIPGLIVCAYRVACKKFHPDRNPAGLEMMKLVNAAYDALEEVRNGAPFDNSIKHTTVGAEGYGDELNAALNAIINLGLNIEVCGSWVWVSGDTKPHKDVLKAANYKWAPKKEMWHFRPAGFKSFGRGRWEMDKIRDRYGSSTVKPREHTRIVHAA